MRLVKPRYRVVAGQERFDERDNVQSRNTLEPGTEDYDQFYRLHPEWKAKDDDIRALPGMGRVGSPLDLPLLGTEYEFLARLGMADRVDGPVNPERQELSAERAAEKVKGFAKHLGADLVRIGPLNPAYVYTNVGKTWHDPARSFGQPIEVTHAARHQRGRRDRSEDDRHRTGDAGGGRDHARLRAAGHHRGHSRRLHPGSRLSRPGPTSCPTTRCSACPSQSTRAWENWAATG